MGRMQRKRGRGGTGARGGLAQGCMAGHMSWACSPRLQTSSHVSCARRARLQGRGTCLVRTGQGCTCLGRTGHGCKARLQGYKAARQGTCPGHVSSGQGCRRSSKNRCFLSACNAPTCDGRSVLQTFARRFVVPRHAAHAANHFDGCLTMVVRNARVGDDNETCKAVSFHLQALSTFGNFHFWLGSTFSVFG